MATYQFTFTCNVHSGTVSYTAGVPVFGDAEQTTWPEIGVRLPEYSIKQHAARLGKEAAQLQALKEQSLVPLSVLMPFLESCVELAKKANSSAIPLPVTPTSAPVSSEDENSPNMLPHSPLGSPEIESLFVPEGTPHTPLGSPEIEPLFVPEVIQIDSDPEDPANDIKEEETESSDDENTDSDGEALSFNHKEESPLLGQSPPLEGYRFHTQRPLSPSSRSSSVSLGALDQTPPDGPLGTQTNTTEPSHIVTPRTSQRGNASQRGDRNEYTRWVLMMTNVDPFRFGIMSCSVYEFRQHLNNCSRWIDKIEDQKISAVCGLQQLPNRNVRIYFPNSDIRDIMANKRYLWTRRFGDAATMIAQTYDVIVPGFPYHNLFHKPDLADKIIHDLLDSNRDKFPNAELPYIHAIRWLPETEDRGKASLVISFYRAVNANKVIASGINHRVTPSTVELLHCSRYYNPAELIQCSGCWQYGHTEFDCEEVRCCVYCGDAHAGSAHSFMDSKNPKCVLCAGAHEANSVDCPVRKRVQQQSEAKSQKRPKFYAKK
ncbi:hypothetical protein GX51_04022 [Blastomyces parvus]|uniref:CCHC-type domain-containing protein n=1 Tax=Blastomyces parvus TaxID=2060905 RepID=A0A2B7X446_9EURO|nr:hypothetical protein GX51_04022 [Blastomyces parvus]